MDEEDQRWMAGGGVGVKSGRHSSAQLQPFELSGELLILLLFSLFAGYLWHPHNIITNIIIWSVIIRVLKARYLILCLFKGFYFWDEERARVKDVVAWRTNIEDARWNGMNDDILQKCQRFWRRIIVLLLWFFPRWFIIDDLIWIFINGFWYDDCYD